MSENAVRVSVRVCALVCVFLGNFVHNYFRFKGRTRRAKTGLSAAGLTSWFFDVLFNLQIMIKA